LALALVIPTPTRSEELSYPPRISLDEIEAQIRDCRKDHPRLLATRRDLTSLAESLKKDPLRKQLADVLVEQAKLLLDARPVERQMEGRRLLHISRQCARRVLVLATAFYLTGDDGYAERAKVEMLAASRFSDWNPSHYLDVAGMTLGLAIGYDWLYDQLDADSRSEIRTAIVEKGLRLPFETKYDTWVRRTNNWGQVCHGGMTLGALAVLEDEPELAAKTVHSALKNVVVSMAVYAPHGSYPEGPGYWSYGTNYSVLTIAALEEVLGTDFGLSQAPGFRETGAYPALMCGPSGEFFSYADGRAERRPEAIRFWFATRYHRPDWLTDERALWKKTLSGPIDPEVAAFGRFAPLALLWMNGADEKSPNRLPLSWSGGGEVPVTVHRSSWTDPRATFVGLKAGSPAHNHGHMDIGSFVLDSDGVRWALDLGAEPYHGIESRGMDLWGRNQGSDRWTIFRLNNYSHNTLVIDGQLQHAAGDAPIERFSDDRKQPFSIVDMTPVYAGQAGSARRGVSLLPSREVIVQDELTGLVPGSRVRWGMLSPGVPEDLGKKGLVLRQHEERLRLSIVSPKTKGWTQIETETPPHQWDSPNPGTRMVAFDAVAPANGKLTLVVALTPGSCAKPAASKRPIVPLRDWPAAR
jgi:hypothetical protein